MYSRSLQLANFGIYASTPISLLFGKQRTLGRRVGLTLFVSDQRLKHCLPDMGAGDHADQVPEYFRHLRKLFLEAYALEVINVARLNSVPAKEIYKDFTDTVPPPKVIYKLGEFTMVSQPIRLILVDWFVFHFF